MNMVSCDRMYLYFTCHRKTIEGAKELGTAKLEYTLADHEKAWKNKQLKPTPLT